jgi:hypothetical protein
MVMLFVHFLPEIKLSCGEGEVVEIDVLVRGTLTPKLKLALSCWFAKSSDLLQVK